MVAPVINFYRTKDEAFYYENSWVNQFYAFKGVQILPNTTTLYAQATDTIDGIIIEDWQVNVVNECTGVKTDITTFFDVELIFYSDNGDQQMIWSVSNVPYDFGNKLIYLEITQLYGESFYSNPFLLTDYEKDKTTVFHYKEKRTDSYQCIGFKTWFRQPNKITDLTTYYQISTKSTVTQAIKTNLLSIYSTENMNIDLLVLLTNILECPYLYVNMIRASLFEAIEIPKLTARESFGIITYSLSLNKNDNYNPANNIYVPPTPPQQNITVYVKPKLRAVDSYGITVYIELAEGYDTIVHEGSYLKLNEQTGVEFQELIFISGDEYRVDSDSTSTYIELGEIQIGVLQLTITNGTNNKVYYVNNANLNFTNTEVINQTTKPLILYIG